MPKNCTECPHTRACQAYFGGIGCHYEKEIAQVAKKQRNTSK